ncbi:hypothetical protein ACIO1C_27545 [Streptomyces sp. NPDC087420]|uniref:hypothetical protein n=1 Tax=Streptomyces sp. NPDC087420 TaxID=3365785 RepID=UPI003838F89F
MTAATEKAVRPTWPARSFADPLPWFAQPKQSRKSRLIMHVLKNLRRLRANRSTRKDYEPFTLLDMLLDDDSERPAQPSSVEIKLFGFRAQSHGRTGFAALRALRREHPVLVHGLYTYLSVSWFLAVLITAFMVQGRWYSGMPWPYA